MKLNKKVLKQWESTANSLRESGAKVEINRKQSYVAVSIQRYSGENNTDFFFQGDEAWELIDQCPENISEEDYILNLATGW